MPVFDTVVVGATDSAGARRAFDRALELASATGATLHVVTAVPRKGAPPPYMPEEFRYTDTGADGPDWLLGQLRARAAEAQVEVASHPVRAEPAEAIAHVATAERADLVVVGTRTTRGARHLSHVDKAVMDRVSCSVLVV
jgi:nucleotide-binding universal stress UspA family protein